jgi:hypothetical protein
MNPVEISALEALVEVDTTEKVVEDDTDFFGCGVGTWTFGTQSATNRLKAQTNSIT